MLARKLLRKYFNDFLLQNDDQPETDNIGPVSNTIGFAIVHLVEHPEALALLREELDSVYPRNGSNVRFEHEDLKNLPYLNAVINETMRIKPVAMGGLPRETDRDYVLGGYHIPKHILITAHIYACQVDPEYWPEPLAFKPERWLEDSDIPADKDAFFPFSSG